jgi:integrase
MASLWKRTNSPYWVCCYTAPDGTQLKRSTKEANRGKAMAICVEIERASRLARQSQLTEVQARKIISDIYQRSTEESLPFADTATFLRDWVGSKEVTRAAGTALRYKRTVEDFLTFLEKRAAGPLSGVTHRDVTRFRDEQIKLGKSPATANMAVKTLRVPFALARRNGLILHSPAEAVELLPSESETRDVFTVEQISALLETKDNEWKGMILLGLYGGLRIGDAARLTWSNIDLPRRTLVFRPQKAHRAKQKKNLEVPLHPSLEKYLLDLTTSDDPKAFIFPRLSQKRVGGAGGLSLAFRKLMRSGGVSGDEEVEKKEGKGRRFYALGFHSLRHTFVSLLANQNVSKEVRMKLAGHTSDAHDRYTHHQLESLRKSIESIPEF